jgi:FtsH-binding integral membrane protein
MFDWNSIIREHFIVLILFINSLGGILKHRTKIDNNLLPIVLFVVAFISSAFWGSLTSVYDGWRYWADVFVASGLFHGGVVTAIAVFGWDAVHGVWKRGLRKKEGGTK